MTHPQAAAERPMSDTTDKLLEMAREVGAESGNWIDATATDLAAFAERIRQDQREKDVATCKAERVDAAATGDATDAAYNRAIDHCISAIGTPA